MNISFRLNGKQVQADVKPDMVLLDLVRQLGCYSVKRGCETANCGLCTIWMDNTPILSCSTLAVRAQGRHITTLEGVQKEAEEFGMFLAREGGEQCGFCSPGFIMNVLAMERELTSPSEEEIKEYLSGNLCRCSGYMSQLRAVKKYLEYKQEGGKA
ncbi:(2Fe-2S)-binding protein [Lacrimispora sp. 210928-DFI.3.58]|uniref:(2Fe-2S)-binding protein n=1 Tax=Lacrimispora sp. 210928-DFI.3.58 TaxID=2883214 RepID=UPI0015B4EA58|nr:(2Fe-2S)-binding protein [Lacrimispora sp. 210928-DFI.3.58]MCB7318587.1 (2Fe-2S)-binding protein [Lacrimispora sp. 210928-DFI.3.58]